MRRSIAIPKSLIALAVFALAGAAPTAPPAAAAPAAQPTVPNPLSTYTLVDTWSEVPWVLTAGRYGDVTDISSAPDGTRYVLDAYHAAIHVLAADGRPERVFELSSPALRDLDPARLDVGADGMLRVLYNRSCTRCDPLSQLDRLTPEGNWLDALVASERYVDVGVRPDGRVYLARSAESSTLGPAAVDVLDASGLILESLQPPELASPIRVDVATDGTVYVLQDVVVPAVPNPGGGGGPRPTPGPSKQLLPPLRVDQQAADPIPGVVIFAPDHAYRETVPFEFGIDVAVGPAGVFVARYGQVFALREADPITPPVGQRWTGRLSLNVPAGGGVVGGLSHCTYQGLIVFDQPALRPAPHRLEGALDRPPLEGPVYPLRISAGDEVTALQGRYMLNGARPAMSYIARPSVPQSVQRWTPTGSLDRQLGVCGPTLEASWTRDLALDGPDIYTADATCVTHRPDDHFPAWTTCINGLWAGDLATQIGAIAADAGRVAVLDIGAGGVALLDGTGGITGHWPLDPGGPAAPPVDIAIAGDRIYLAYQGQAEIEVRGLDGARLAAWPLADAPLALGLGPGGDVFILGRGGWAYRYSADGAIEAAWPLPVRDGRARDIAVGRDGRVFVNTVVIDNRFSAVAEITDAGIWVFAPSAAPPTELPPGPGRCEATPDKRAAPGRIPLGDPVTVTLDVRGRCPAQAQPVQLAIVFDTSRSMSWGYVIDTAKDAVLRLLLRLDPRLTEVTLVSFDDAGALDAPLSRDLIAVSQRVAALTTGGDTRMAEGIELARRELTGPKRDPAARPIILLVTDANPKDQTIVALEAARSDGIDLSALVFEAGQAADPDFVSLFQDQGGNLLYDPQTWEIAAFTDGLVPARDEPGLFTTITVTDLIPRNMRYLSGSAQPAATFDPTAHSLTWQLNAVQAATGLRLSYRLEPLEVGTWPTNVEATADYRDVLGRDGHLLFPVPEVTVYQPVRQFIYLPFLLRDQCIRKDRPADVVLVLDASVSMAEPAAPGGTATKLDAARAAAMSFVRLLNLGPDGAGGADRAAVVAFSETARRLTGLTGDAAAIEQSLAGLASTPGTRIDRGMAEARAVLAAAVRPGAQPVVILLTDGMQSGQNAPVRAEAAALGAAGALVYTIGLGADIDRELLRAVATSPDRYQESPTAADLAAIYAKISARLACGG
jgi:Mg-chelatase subunit ChlD